MNDLPQQSSQYQSSQKYSNRGFEGFQSAVRYQQVADEQAIATEPPTGVFS